MPEIILHHYDRSPFSEKVRLVLGLKAASWRSVEIPRWMPKPDLMPLTGGYRKTPIMQMGADIYCDTRCILREIDRRIPRPALYPAGGAEAAAAWADGPLFTNGVGVVFGTLADKLPQELKEDRRKFTAGMFDADRMKAAQPAIRAQWRANMRLIERAFADGRPFILGGAPSIADFAHYHVIWFLRLNLPERALLAAVDGVEAWYERMTAFGHGTKTPLDAKEALAIAKAASPAPLTARDDGDPSGCRPGQAVTVAANDYGRDPVKGELLSVDAEEIVIRRRDAALGELQLHFPRVGFDLRAA